MSVQLFGIDEKGRQVYQYEETDAKNAKKSSDMILEGSDHITSIIAIEKVVNISKTDHSSVIVSYDSRFLFINTRDEK